MSAKITPVTIGKHEFIAGLTWVPLTRPRELKADIKTQLGKYNYDSYAVLQGNGVAQVGMANQIDGATSQRLTLAGAIASHMSTMPIAVDGARPKPLRDWLGIFEVAQDLWFLIAVRDGSIISNCDSIGPFEQIHDMLEQSYGIPGWAAVIGSPSLPNQRSYHNFVALDVQDAIGMKDGKLAKASRFAMKTAASKKGLVLGVIAVAVIGALGATGWTLYQSSVQQAELAELERLRAEADALMQGSIGQKQQVAIVKGWVTLPTPTSIANTCMQHLDIPASPGTWDLASYSCTPDGSSVKLKRHDRTNVGYLKETLQDAVVAPDQNEATWQRPFDALVTAEDALLSWAEIATDLFAKLQTLGISFDVGAPVSPTPPELSPEEEGKIEYIPATWLERTFRFGPTTEMPQGFVPLVDMSGLRINKITYENGMWTYEGMIYAQ